MSEEKTQPAKKYKSGAITLTRWDNKRTKDGQDFVVSSFNPERFYKNEKDEIVNITSFRVNDLPDLILTCQKAFEDAKFKEV